MQAVLFIIGGFVLLLGGGEALVRGAVGIARRFGLSELLIGLTVVAFGTSAPELAVSVRSALSGMPDLAVGNVVGSNIANIAFILGVACLIRPVTVDRADIRPDAYTLIGASLLMVPLGLMGGISRPVGALMVAALAYYLFASYRREIRSNKESTDWHTEEAAEFPTRFGVGTSLLLLAAGLGALVIGTELLIGGAVEIAALFGVPDAVVGLTVVAIGTSLPELATSAVAAMRHHSDVAVGNVLGSNLFNILSILGITSVVSPISIDRGIAVVDIPLMIAVTLIAVFALLRTGHLGRLWGAGLTIGYAVYVVALYLVR